MLRPKYLILSGTLFFFFVFYLFVTDNSGFAISIEPKFAPGQIIVKLKQNAMAIPLDAETADIDKTTSRSPSIKNMNTKYKVTKIKQALRYRPKDSGIRILKSGKIVQRPDISNVFILEVPVETDIKKAVEEYSKDPDVIYAEPNYICYALAITPDDPDYQSGDPNDDPNQWGLYKIGLVPTGSGESGWDIEKGTGTVTVAVLDTGIYLDHFEMTGKAYSGYDFVNSDFIANDDMGHGTHVAGIIGAKTNNGADPNGKGIAGTDWNCRLMAVKCLDRNGDGFQTDIADSIYYAVNHDADIINMSLGTYGPTQTLNDAISYAHTSEVVLIASAGNDNVSNKIYPAGYDEVIAVAATNPYDQKASYSNYGNWVDVAAPGGDTTKTHWILSTWISSEAEPNRYGWLAGTSMAAPFVSGLAALLKAQNPGWSKAQIEDRIKTYSDNIDDYNPGYQGLMGSGRINAKLALGGLRSYISSPADGGTGYGLVEILGTATGEGFDHYTVEYGVGTSPATWATAEASNPNTKLNEVLASINTTGSSEDFSVKLTVNGLATTESKVTFHAGSGQIPVALAKPMNGPNPFNPLTDSTMIKYKLSSNGDTHIYIFDISGNLIWQKKYVSGTDGGWQGENNVYWNGRSNFGEVVANGVYLYKIVSGNRILGSGKIIVLK